MNEEPFPLEDDEDDFFQALGTSQSDLGYKVFTAANDAEGISLFERLRPGIVSTDIQTRGMDGIEVDARIKKDRAAPEVIMNSCQGDLELATKCLKHEAAAFISNRFQPEILQIAVRCKERW